MQAKVKRIDHLGIIAGVAKDLGIADFINEMVGRKKLETVSAGDVVVGMILNGLAFISRPLMLTPQFFENKPLELLIGKGVKAEHMNRHKLGRVLDRVQQCGTEFIFKQISLKACQQEKVDMTFAHADTTTYSLTGEYDQDFDTERIEITYGHSKAKRPDLKQVVQELITSQDGGIPLITKAFDGNASDTVILRERAQNLMKEFAKSGERIFVADSKLYASKTAETLNHMNFITRVPSTIKTEKAAIDQAIKADEKWNDIGNGYKIQEIDSDQFDIQDQRWIIIFSEQAQKRVKKTIGKAITKENERIKKEVLHLQAERFTCEEDAKKKALRIAKKWGLHTIMSMKLTPIRRCEKRGRPSKETPQTYEWQINVQFEPDEARIALKLQRRSCFVLATNVSNRKLPAQQVLINYKEQDKTEKGFAFLKGSSFFTSSLFIKKPGRIEGLLMIMVLSLLVYSIAQRRVRQQLKLLKSTIPNQINQPTNRPTMRWIFQLFEGVNLVLVQHQGSTISLLEGVTEIRQKIIDLLAGNTKEIYQNFKMAT